MLLLRKVFLELLNGNGKIASAAQDNYVSWLAVPVRTQLNIWPSKPDETAFWTLKKAALLCIFGEMAWRK
jgi:hypothetical protein